MSHAYPPASGMREVPRMVTRAPVPPRVPFVVFLLFFCFSFFKVMYIFYIIKIKSNKLRSNCGLHVINCPEMSSIGWKIEWNASGTRADVTSLSSKI